MRIIRTIVCVVLLCGLPKAQAVAQEPMQMPGANSDPVMIRMQTSFVAEAAGDVAAAYANAREAFGLRVSYSTAIRCAWLALQLAQYSDAEQYYEESLQLSPESLDAALGLQLARLLKGDWHRSILAGYHVLKLVPGNDSALARIAYAHFADSKYANAEMAYQRALSYKGDDAELLFGLGFSQVYQDKPEGRETCARAAAVKMDEARIAACNAIPLSSDLHLFAEVEGGAMQYSNQLLRSSILYGTALAGFGNNTGNMLWLGGTSSKTAMNEDVEDYNQDVAVLGGALGGETWKARLSVGGVSSSEDSIEGAYFGTVGLAAFGSYVDGSVEFAAARYSGLSVMQGNAEFGLSAWGQLRFSLGAEASESTSALSGSADRIAAKVGIAWRPANGASLAVSGYAGERQYAIDGQGLGIWPGDEVFSYGYAAKGVLPILDSLALQAGIRHDFGIEQAGSAHDFEIFGGHVGFQFYY